MFNILLPLEIPFFEKMVFLTQLFIFFVMSIINLENAKVLMVDDTPANIDILRKSLVNEGYQLFFANSGEKALKIANRAIPDLILLDVMMPKMSGFETAHRLKENKLTQEIPVIFLTAKNQPEDLIEGFQLGAVDYINKPFRQEEVCLRVRAHLQKCFLMKQMTQARMAAEAANHAKSTFLANMSHELRTPLNGILGYTQILMKDKSLSALQEDGIEIIHRSGEHLLTLINDILDLSKIEAGRVELHPSDFNLGSFFKHILELFKIRAKQKNIAFHYQTNTALPYVVYGDEKRLRQIIINLLGNAIKFTEQGSVTFRVAYQESKIRFEVIDTGIGIASEELENIFLPFQQVGEMYKQPEGTGLGLAITKTLIEMMGGEIQVKTVLGQGSTFWTELELPKLSGEVLPNLEDESIIVGFEGKTRTVLIVDDNEANRSVLVRLLEPLGLKILEASHGQECVDRALKDYPDVILMDLIMPVMNGFEASKAIRKIPELKETVIIAISASAFNSDKEKSIKAGCTDFIAKPFVKEVLFEKLQHHLNLTWRYEEKNQSSEDSDFVAPSPKQAAELFNFVKMGDIQGIEEYLEQLQQQNSNLQAFVQKIQTLARKMEMMKIRKMVEPYVDGE